MAAVVAGQEKNLRGMERWVEDESDAVSNIEIFEAQQPNKKTEKNKKEKKKDTRLKIIRYTPMFRRCFNLGNGTTSIDESEKDGGLDMVSARRDEEPPRRPSHLVIMSNGIIGNAQNWKFAARQFLKAHPDDVIVHCSKRNYATRTFDGVDVMGKRLADEVLCIVERCPYLRKISFVGHSLGGLIIRYAIALLYERNPFTDLSDREGKHEDELSSKAYLDEKYKGKIAGLEPINFITSATPHLGSRGHKQVPMFCGVHSLEVVARKTSWWLGRTGKHLFLTDHDNGQPPLLLQMVKDCEDLPFISALQSFKRRVLYANVRYDLIVGWCTSSIRLPQKLPKRRQLSRINGSYRHIVVAETARSPSQEEVCASASPSSITQCWRNFNTQEMMEAMIRGLSKVSWERVDVIFSERKPRFFSAHGAIQVQRPWMHSDGADVIQHMVDNFLL